MMRCVFCGTATTRTPRFQAAFPSAQVVGDRYVSAFPVEADAAVPTWMMTQCDSCGGVSPDPYPSAQEIADFYLGKEETSGWEDLTDWETVHYIRLDLNPKALEGSEVVADKLVRLSPSGRTLLEVGCASGWVLKAVRDRGRMVKGVEAAPRFADFARERLGLDVFSGLISDVPTEEWPKWDVVAMFDAFEHLHDPISDLGTLRELVEPDGLLVLTTPNIASPVARLWGLKWRQILPSHINYSTPTAIAAALARSGWELVHLSEPRYWDPDPQEERRQRVRETGKYLLRWLLYLTVVMPSRRLPLLRRLPSALSRNRLSWDDFLYRVGDQPVLGDVMLVVARAV